MRFYCIKCVPKMVIFSSFKDFRLHMEYDHGFNYLAQRLENMKFIARQKKYREDFLQLNSNEVPDVDIPSEKVSTFDIVDVENIHETVAVFDEMVELEDVGKTWRTELLEKLIEKEQKLTQLQCDLESASAIRVQLQSELETLRSWFNANDSIVMDLRNALEKKNMELEELKINHDNSVFQNDQHIKRMQRQLVSLIENTHVAEQHVKFGHAVEPQFEVPTKMTWTSSTGQIIADPNAEYVALVLVFCHLDLASRLQCTKVCRSWYRAVRNPVVWISLNLTCEVVTNRMLMAIAPYCTQTKVLKLKQLRMMPTVQCDESKRGMLEVGLERLLCAMHQTLEKIMIIDCGNVFTNRCLWLISCYCRKLQSLTYISDTDPVSGECLWALGCGCRSLNTLIIPPLHPSQVPENFTNHCLYVVSEAFCHLKVLCVGGSEIDVRGLSSIAKNCSELEELELDHMGEIREKTAVTVCHYGFKHLQVLAFTYTSVTPKALLHFFNHCRNLKMIRICLEFSVYYPNPKNRTLQNRKRYTENIEHVKMLQKRPNLCDILFISAEELTD